MLIVASVGAMETYQCSGTVTDSATHNPIYGARVFIVDPATNQTLAAVWTDSMGYYQTDIVTSIGSPPPQTYWLNPIPYPNPSSGLTVFEYSSPAELLSIEEPLITLYDITGRRVNVGYNLAAGIYLYRLTVPNKEEFTGKLLHSGGILDIKFKQIGFIGAIAFKKTVLNPLDVEFVVLKVGYHKIIANRMLQPGLNVNNFEISKIYYDYLFSGIVRERGGTFPPLDSVYVYALADTDTIFQSVTDSVGLYKSDTISYPAHKVSINLNAVKDGYEHYSVGITLAAGYHQIDILMVPLSRWKVFGALHHLRDETLRLIIEEKGYKFSEN